VNGKEKRLPEETPAVKVETQTERKVEQVAEPIVTDTIAEEPVVEQLAVPVEEVADAPEKEAPAAPIAEAVESAPTEEAPAVVESTAVSPAHEVTEIQEEDNALPYNKNMSVEEICALMSVDEARNYVVPVGTCKNWTIDQVASRRPISLKYYLSAAYTGDDNILRAAATIMLKLIESNAA